MAPLPARPVFALGRYVTVEPDAPRPTSLPTDVRPFEPSDSPPSALPAPLPPGAGGDGASAGGFLPQARPPLLEARGEVRVAAAVGDGAVLPGASVTARNAWAEARVTAGDDGRFTFSLPGPATEVLITHARHVPSLVAGWPADGLTVHLREVEVTPAADRVIVPVGGRVLDEQGQPVAGALVAGGNAEGASFGPLITGPDGRFSGMVTASGGAAEASYGIWSYLPGDEAGPLALGHAERQPQANGDLGDLGLLPAGDRLLLDPTGPEGRRRGTVEAIDAQGVALVLAAWQESFIREWVTRDFNLPGVRLQATITFSTTDGAASTWRGDAHATPALLAYPASPRRGLTLSWPAVPGAESYMLTFRERGAGVPAWEGLSAGTSLVPRGLPDLPGELELMALAGNGAALRSLSGLSPPRALRLPPAGGRADRWSTRLTAWPPS